MRGYWPEMNVAFTLAGDIGWPLTVVVGGVIVAWVVSSRGRDLGASLIPGC
jgi:hypothetical protein